MQTEVSIMDGSMLYVLYGLFVLGIVAFVFVITKKGSAKGSSKYTVDSSLNKTFENKTHKQEKIKEVKKVPKQEPKPLKRETPVTHHEKPKAFIYKKDIPVYGEIEPSVFEYFNGSKILVVEDNKINQKILLNVLKNIKTDIDVANNGEEAVEKIITQNQQYDLVLMDISMPIMDGIQATKIIREKISQATMPIVTVTAFTSGVEIAQMFDVGTNAFLTKPLDIHKLFIVMMLYLDNTKSQTPIQRELEIIGVDLDMVEKSIHANHKELQEAIKEFVNKYSHLEYDLAYWIDNNDLTAVQRSLDELDMILDLIGAKEMQRFIEDMRQALKTGENIESYKILFIAKFRALIYTYRRYINSI